MFCVSHVACAVLCWLAVQLAKQTARQLAERDFTISELQQELDRCKLHLHAYSENSAIDADDTEILHSQLAVAQVRTRSPCQPRSGRRG